ncbi:hypothetical protein GCM10023221_06010 [Luteimicrobium xylanilyticum]|uniref:Uncharacterized protein n=1 Tax=Luteimicrobium xylanilyticum TaxID=1133546 RepID=A0A5P9QAE7_9MICO|nr:hypothetical protein [Luteimicrobium xylanilyticum]QFU98413.1 hypothetical protein KDY119_01925 [Luteimicrobium xylanilyticum]
MTQTVTLAQVYKKLDATDRRRLAELDHLESQVLTRLVHGGEVDGLPMFSELARRRLAIYEEASVRPAVRTTALDVPTPPEGTRVDSAGRAGAVGRP